MKNRKEELNELLRPIIWAGGTSIGYRQQLVCQRRSNVFAILPFLTKKELERANKWLEEEKHEGLWD